MKPSAFSLALIAPLLGCALLDELQDDGGVINVFATHHATPAGGAFPDRDGPAVFVNEEGWQVVLRAALDSAEAVVAHFETVIRQLRIACFCTGAGDLAALRRVHLLPNALPLYDL